MINNRVLYGEFTISYLTLQKGECQGDPISAYLFILVLEVLFELIKNNSDIRRITIFSHAISYTEFADNSTIFLGGFISVRYLINIFKELSLFLRLKSNFSKCETAGIGSLKIRGILQF